VRAWASPLLAAALLAAAGGARADEVRISWEQDLAFEWDRERYEKTLRELAGAAEAEVAAWLGWTRAHPLELRVVTRAHYEAQFGSGMAWNTGAHYFRRVIHVNGGARLDGWFAGLLAHEITHAYLDGVGTGHRFPPWLGEGLAERLGYRSDTSRRSPRCSSSRRRSGSPPCCRSSTA
jgi:hypothetical protein